MKLKIYTVVWVGEFDKSEFPHYESHAEMDGSVYVTEVIEFDPAHTEFKFEA